MLVLRHGGWRTWRGVQHGLSRHANAATAMVVDSGGHLRKGRQAVCCSPLATAGYIEDGINVVLLVSLCLKFTVRGYAVFRAEPFLPSNGRSSLLHALMQ